MSDQHPVPIRKVAYVVDNAGAVTPYRQPPPPAKLLNREERVDAYREGLRRATAALQQLGFQTHHCAEHTVSMEFRGYLFDFRIQKPQNVAHITSGQGNNAKTGRPNVSIYKLSDEIKSEFALQLIIGKEFTARPLFVALEESIADPAQHILDAVTGFLAALNTKEHRLGKATVGKHEELGYAPKQLPEWIDV